MASTKAYTCPMHPEIGSDNAGDVCSICGMDLVENNAMMSDSTQMHMSMDSVK
ncbi:MAG: hypothetical protein GZ091_16620 [Paludibacter sp.]|nr:hypothetical protein [Paludibacter sp.]